LAYTFTRAQLSVKAQAFAATAGQQSTAAAAIPYLAAANALADCVMGRVWDFAVAQGYATGLGAAADTSQTKRTTLLMNADAALVSANTATGQAQLDHLTVAQGWSKLAEAVACNELISQQYNNNG